MSSYSRNQQNLVREQATIEKKKPRVWCVVWSNRLWLNEMPTHLQEEEAPGQLFNFFNEADSGAYINTKRMQ